MGQTKGRLLRKTLSPEALGGTAPDLSAWAIRIRQGEIEWGTRMKAAQGARRVRILRRILPASPCLGKRARPGAYGSGGWRDRPQAAGDRTGENTIIGAPNVGRGSRLH